MKDKKQIREQIAREVEKTLRALDGQPPVKASAFFHTRLQHRLDRLATEEPAPPLRWSRLRPVAVSLLVAVSVLLGILIGGQPESSQPGDTYTGFVESYNLQAPDLDDYQLSLADR